MRLLAIESSCDDSAAAWLDVGDDGRIARLENLVATQVIHAKFGGVVPEVAAREHSAAMPHLLDALAEKVTGTPDGRALAAVTDVIAATQGPGLITSLKVGLDTARALAAAWGKPFVGVNHIAGHIAANWLPGAGLETRLRGNDKLMADADVFPSLALVVSGGHTELLLMPRQGEYRLLGATRDDAAGEAFDKTAKLMGLGYPGGPLLSKRALTGNPSAHDFPRPMMHDAHDDFSFSGLKTSVRYFLDQNRTRFEEPGFLDDVAASTQAAIVEVLVAKTVRAARREGVKSVLLAGGVAANASLREALTAALITKLPGVRFSLPALAYCGDNASMIAMAAYFQARDGRFTDWRTADASSSWELGREY